MNKDRLYVENYFTGKEESRADKIKFLGACAMVVFFLVAALLS